MTSVKVKLFCIVEGDSSAFPVKLDADDTVGELKKAIKEEQSPLFDDIRASELVLYSVEVADEGFPVHLKQVESKTLLAKSTKSIKAVFGENPAPDTIHCIVQRPEAAPGATINVAQGQKSFQLSPPSSRPCSPSQDLETTIRKITASFFANDSPAAIFLNDY
ncbi:hypothetical protein BGZ49_002858, partial [Haplosporangium sp. Z 27]